MKLEKTSVIIKPYKVSDLMRIYGISRYVLNNFLRKHPEISTPENDTYFSIEQVEKIFSLLKLPRTIVIED